MKSFPSSLNRGNKNIIMNHASKSLLDVVVNSFKDAFKKAWYGSLKAGLYGAKPTGAEVNIDGLPFDDSIDKKALLKGLNFTKFRDYRWGKIPRSSSRIDTDTSLNIENPYNFDSNAIAIMNKYRSETLAEVVTSSNVGSTHKKTNEGGQAKGGQAKGGEAKGGQAKGGQAKGGEAGEETRFFGYKDDLKRSLFNPYNGVHVIGMTENIPLLYDQDETKYQGPERLRNISDCSISRLVSLSSQKSSILGQARYKYADFAFCKDLGMPNNRLITLRKFSIPVGDYIFRAAAHNATIKEGGNEKGGEVDNPFTTPGDIGRMCCYFDTDDNKLEDILKYSFAGSWKEMKAEIQQINSQENDHVTPLGSIINALNPSMNSALDKGFSGASNHLIGRAFNSWFGWNTDQYYSNTAQNPMEYDKHRIYTPRNTIQSMHRYEGNLEFKHEFTLVFSYKLRSYQNINPKSAMLDLLANVFATTYSRGRFWGGRNEIIGAQPNRSGWNKADQLLNKGEDVIGGLFSSLIDGTFDAGALMGSLGNHISKAWQGAQKFIGDLVKDPYGSLQSMVQSGAKTISKINDKTGIMKGVKGILKNQLGRPEIYAFQSLLDGSNTGLWHVTIGNPLNPIASIGNLIITDTQVQQFGPLGIDDFPTELKVTVTLKHARPRDAVAMERMYTKGVGAIYMPLTGRREKVFREDVKEKIGSLDYFGEFEPERTKRNADELG